MVIIQQYANMENFTNFWSPLCTMWAKLTDGVKRQIKKNMTNGNTKTTRTISRCSYQSVLGIDPKTGNTRTIDLAEIFCLQNPGKKILQRLVESSINHFMSSTSKSIEWGDSWEKYAKSIVNSGTLANFCFLVVNISCCIFSLGRENIVGLN